MRVWIDAWQQECCGEPFRAGDVVAWEANERAAVDGLVARVGADRAAGVRYVQEHHGDDPDGVVSGAIARIDEVVCRRDEGALVVGSGHLREVVAVPENPQGPEQWTREGWIVEIVTTASGD